MRAGTADLSTGATIMKVLINGKEKEKLSAWQERLVAVGRKQEDITGSVITAEEATAALMRWTRIFLTSVVVLAGVLFVGIMVVAMYGLQPSERAPTIAFALVMMGVSAGLIRWGYRRTERRWRARLPERVAALPPPGTPVRLDAVGVVIGGRSFAWSELGVGQVELQALSSPDGTTYLVERLVLRGPGSDITLDRNLMQNGALIVENAYRRLLRETSSPTPANTGR
jgi:hypothetical protein